jgi:hypothetical protein
MNQYDQGAHDVLLTLAEAMDDNTAADGAMIPVATVTRLLRQAARDVANLSRRRRPNTAHVAPTRAARRAAVLRRAR